MIYDFLAYYLERLIESLKLHLDEVLHLDLGRVVDDELVVAHASVGILHYLTVWDLVLGALLVHADIVAWLGLLRTNSMATVVLVAARLHEVVHVRVGGSLLDWVA